MTTNSSPLLFNLTRQIIEEAERRVLNFKSNGPLIDSASRNGLFPIAFIQLGLSELMRPLFKWAMFSIVLLVAALVFLPKANLSPDAKNSIFLLCTFAPLFLITFAIPSTFSFDTITGTQISTLADYIFNLGFKTEAKLKALAECVSLVAERTYARTKTFQGIVAIIWGLFLYGLNQFTNIGLKLAPEQSAKIFSDNFSALILYGLVSFLSLVVILGYKKANDAVFKRLSFSVEELKFRVASYDEFHHSKRFQNRHPVRYKTHHLKR